MPGTVHNSRLATVHAVCRELVLHRAAVRAFGRIETHLHHHASTSAVVLRPRLRPFFASDAGTRADRGLRVLDGPFGRLILRLVVLAARKSVMTDANFSSL